MQRKLTAVIILTLTFLSTFFTACNNASEVGGDLVRDEVSIVVDSSFTISSQSVRNDAVLSRTIVQLLGIIDAPEYGTIRSDFVTQFMPANVLDTAGVTVNDVDSLKLVMLVNPGSFTGDSLALMGVEVYPLTRQLSAPIYSNFDPEGYYDPTAPLGSTVYNLLKSSEPDSLAGLTFHSIIVDLPIELGRRFFTDYINRPAVFGSPTAFAQYFPGLYVRNSYGSGRVTRIGNTTMQMFYHQHTKTAAGNDTIINKVGNYFAVTPEIITNNDISLNVSTQITDRIARGESILLAPAGYNVEIKFPAREIIAAYNNGTRDGLGVVNRLTFRIPVEPIANKYDIGAPDDVLLVLKKDYEKFFINNSLPDGATSFNTSLTQLADESYAYVFSDMRKYIVDLMAKDQITDDDLTFILVPVSVTSETSSDYYTGTSTTLTGVNPYVSNPKMAKILTDKAKINFIYSLQTTNF